MSNSRTLFNNSIFLRKPSNAPLWLLIPKVDYAHACQMSCSMMSLRKSLVQSQSFFPLIFCQLLIMVYS